MSWDQRAKSKRARLSPAMSQRSPRAAGAGNAAARRYAGVSPGVQKKPGAGNEPGRHAAAVDGGLPDAVEPAGAQTRDVTLAQGELLKVDVSAQEAVELVVLSQQSGVVSRETGASLQASYQAVSRERVRIQTRPPAGGLQIGPGPSARVMISVEPPGRAETSLEGDGAAYLNARQHLLLNLFGINPTSLHPRSGLELAEALDALEVIARAIGAEPDKAPSGARGHGLTVAHSQSGAIEQATYELTSSDAALRLDTTFDSSSGSLHCALSFEHVDGVRVLGSLTHTVALSDGVPVTPASDPVGAYLRHDPGAFGELDDFSDVVGEQAGAQSREGVGSFLEGAVAGDLAGNDSWSAVGGQVAVGFVPVAGQVADARDIAAAGSDVFQGKEGAWARLGIAVVAVIPGLDFLKGGSKAGRKALKEASEEAAEGVSKAGIKRLGKVLSKEAAARAARELKTLAVGRREMLARMQSLLVDEGLSGAAKSSIRRARNAVQDHLHPSDLSGALRDKRGLPVRRSGSGEAWDHLNEVQSVLESLKKARRDMKRELYKLQPGSAQYRKLSREIDAISEIARRAEKFLEIQ